MGQPWDWRHLAFCTAALVIQTSNARADQQIDYGNATGAERSQIDRAITTAKKLCEPLFTAYSDDISKIQAYVKQESVKEADGSYTCMTYRCDKFHWHNSVALLVVMKDNTNVIPSKLRASGQTEYIYVGGPPNDGLTVMKIPELCGAQKNQKESDVFVRALDTLKSRDTHHIKNF